jgi:hypothetical protein
LLLHGRLGISRIKLIISFSHSASFVFSVTTPLSGFSIFFFFFFFASTFALA